MTEISRGRRYYSHIRILIRSLSIAHLQEISIAVFLHSVLVRQMETLTSSNLPEPAKREVLELLSKSLIEFRISLKEDRTEKLKVAIACVFGGQFLTSGRLEDSQNIKRQNQEPLSKVKRIIG